MADTVKWSKTISDVNREILVNLEKPHPMFYVVFFFALTLFLAGVVFVGLHTTYGLGLWRFAPPLYWAVDITNFVFWVGIGHAGTLISAILFLFRAKWRNTVNRSAEAMTIFAVMAVCGSVHTGLFLCQIRTTCGLTFALRSYGTCLRSRHTLQYLFYSGTWDLSLT